jgi:hypothetical protein
MVDAVNETYRVEGLSQLEEVFIAMAGDFGFKKVGNTLVKPAVDYAFRPVLETARSLAPQDTGVLRQSIKQYTRRATDRDRNMRGATQQTAYVSIVRARDAVKKVKAQEFGTKRGVTAKHYLRYALERNAQNVLTNLEGGLTQLLIRYQSKFTGKPNA